MLILKSVGTKETFIDFVLLEVKTLMGHRSNLQVNLRDTDWILIYDNEATIAGVNSEVQKTFLDLNPLVIVIHCVIHLIWLEFVQQMWIQRQCCFFRTVEYIFIFCSYFTHKFLKEVIKIIVLVIPGRVQNRMQWSS